MKRYALVPAVTGAALVVVLPLTAATAAAPADFTWTGTNAFSNQTPIDDEWTQPNWTTASPMADQPIGALTFPHLSGCTIGAEACYMSDNNIGTLSANAIFLDDTDTYQITGDQLDLGSGGLTASPSDNASGYAAIGNDLALGADQNWSVTGNGGYETSELELDGHVTGNSADVTAQLADDVILDITNAEVGTFNVKGAVTTDTGFKAVRNGAIDPVSLNATDGKPVNATNVLVDTGNQTRKNLDVGPLTVTGGFLQVGYDNAPDNLVTVHGGVTLNAGTVTQLDIDSGGNAPSTDYSQLIATGDVKLGGTLSLTAASAGCVVPSGSTETLITTTGTVSGSFSNVKNGGLLPFSDCYNHPDAIRVHYNTHSVTTTPVAAATTDTEMTAAPTTITVGKKVALSAAITTGTIQEYGPSGTVAFLDGRKVISGCTAQKLTPTSDSSGTATCSAKLPSGHPSASVTAVFTPTPGTGLNKSTSPAVSIKIKAAATPTLGHVTTKGKTAKASVSCAGTGSCKVTLTLTYKKGSKKTGVGKKAATVTARHHKTIAITLDATGKKLLKAHKKLPVALTMTSTSKNTTKTVTFKG